MRSDVYTMFLALGESPGFRHGEVQRQAKLISLLNKKVISQRQDYKVMSELYQNDSAIRDEIIKAYRIKRDELLGRLQI